MNKLRSSGLLAPLYPPTLSPTAWAIVAACVLLLRPAAVAGPPKPEGIETPRRERVVELPKSVSPVPGKSAPKTHSPLPNKQARPAKGR